MNNIITNFLSSNIGSNDADTHNKHPKLTIEDKEKDNERREAMHTKAKRQREDNLAKGLDVLIASHKQARTKSLTVVDIRKIINMQKQLTK